MVCGNFRHLSSQFGSLWLVWNEEGSVFCSGVIRLLAGIASHRQLERWESAAAGSHFEVTREQLRVHDEQDSYPRFFGCRNIRFGV